MAYGLGLGLGFQVPNIAAQTVLPGADVPVGTALVMFAQLLGGAVFVSVGQSVLASELTRRLADSGGFEARGLRGTGVTTLLAGLRGEEREAVIEAYNEALRRTFYVGLAMACCAVLAGSFMEWRSVKEHKVKEQGRGQGDAVQRGEEESAAALSPPAEGGENKEESEKEDKGV